MNDQAYDAIVIGAGPAGLAAAIALKEEGIGRVLVLEREAEAGGILNQCIHDGFGLIALEKNYTGPEYADLYIRKAIESGVEIRTGAAATAMRIAVADGADGGTGDGGGRGLKEIAVRTDAGPALYRAGAVVLATGCRERPRGAMLIPGSRPAGIYTAGSAQNFVNLRNLLPGTRAVILGSGDIGLIMARRLTLEGIDVLAVIEKEKAPGGLPRNIIQCLDDFGIPLITGATVTKIVGDHRLEAIEVSDLSEDGRPIPGSEKTVACDTLILSVGLIPENEVGQTAGLELDDATGLPATDGTVRTALPGVFVCGNANYVHDLVDDVSYEGEQAGRMAAAWILGIGTGTFGPDAAQRKRAMEGRRKKAAEGSVICILCPNSCEITYELKGALCGKGVEYVRKEFLQPERTLTTSVRVVGGCRPLASVRTSAPIPRELLRQAAKEARLLSVEAPVTVGQIVCHDFMKASVDLLATCNVKKNMVSDEPV